MSHHERLSALDAAFFDVETPTSAMTVGAVLVLGPGPLIGGNGELDLAHVRALARDAVAAIPRYRQRVVRVPLLGQPVWIDDDRFDLDLHLRHVRVPWPGDARALDELAGALLSQHLDHDHPLWRWWLVEGVEGGGFAIIMQAHHCLTDGVGGADLIARVLSTSPRAAETPAEIAPPRPRPGALALVRDEVRHHNRRTIAMARAAWHRVRDRGHHPTQAREAAHGIVETLRSSLHPAPATPLNPDRIGPERAFASLRVELAHLAAVRASWGGTINDVALAAVTGALRAFLANRGVDVDRMPPLRALVPVSTRSDGDGAVLGNRVAMMLADLPIALPDIAGRYAAIRAGMEHLKHDSGEALGTELAIELADVVSTRLLTATIELAVRLRAFNLTVTNVRGSERPLYLAGSRVLAIYPKVPLYRTQGVGVALFGYDGALDVGLSACRHTVPDLRDLRDQLARAFDELLAASSATRVGAIA